jgi:hypothetical protein
MHAKAKLIDGWKIKSWLDWTVAMLSFVLFLTLESVVIYSYWIFLGEVR